MLTSRFHNLLIALLLTLLCGLPVAQAEFEETLDRFERFNRTMFTFNDRLDRAVLTPLARGYQAVTPKPVDNAISNFFSNLGDVFVIGNDLLQLEFEQALRNTTRLAYNTTFGIGGLFDVATRMELPKSNNDFGQTLAHWGVGEGDYLVLPIFGPSTTRDMWRIPVDGILLDPITYVEPVRVWIALRVFETIDTRAGLLGASRLLDEAALDPYSFQREAYLQRRRALILGEEAAMQPFDFDFDDDDDFEDEPLPEGLAPAD